MNWNYFTGFAVWQNVNYAVADLGFPRRGRQPQSPHHLLFGQFFPENCMKMKEIGPAGRGGEGASLAPLWSANAMNVMRIFVLFWFFFWSLFFFVFVWCASLPTSLVLMYWAVTFCGQHISSEDVQTRIPLNVQKRDLPTWKWSWCWYVAFQSVTTSHDA